MQFELRHGLQLRYTVNALHDPDTLGAEVNQHNQYWVALKPVDDIIWRLDSTSAPEPLTPSDYIHFINLSTQLHH